MAEPGAAESRERAFVPTHAPMWITIVAIVIATVFASALVYVLFKETTGPGEVLRDFYVAVNDGDCEDAYALTSGLDELGMCSHVAELEGSVPTDPQIGSILLEGDSGDVARVTLVETPDAADVVWRVELLEDQWLITACPDTGALAGAC